MTGVEFREVDQGQHDGRSDVLAVGTAGMLVRREVWDRLGGPDPGSRTPATTSTCAAGPGWPATG